MSANKNSSKIVLLDVLNYFTKATHKAKYFTRALHKASFKTNTHLNTTINQVLEVMVIDHILNFGEKKYEQNFTYQRGQGYRM